MDDETKIQNAIHKLTMEILSTIANSGGLPNPFQATALADAVAAFVHFSARHDLKIAKELNDALHGSITDTINKLSEELAKEPTEAANGRLN